MNLRVNGRHINVSDSIRAHIDKKVEKLERYLPNLDEVQVELSKSVTHAADDRFTCQLTVWDHRNILRAEVTNGRVYGAIDGAVQKLSHQIEKVRGRQKNHQHLSLVANTEAALAGQIDPPIEEIGRIVRRKTFAVPPMSEDEAIEQMELLSHDFFLFINLADNEVNVIYRRQDNHYGLLQPILN